MSNNAPSFPAEVWLNVFNMVKMQGGNLAACRLVCRAWKSPAERVMYKQIDMSSWAESPFALLYNHLSARPDLGHLVQEITAKAYMEHHKQLRQILQLTPNLKIINGLWTDELANEIFPRGKLPSLKLQKLPRISNNSQVLPILQGRYQDSLTSGFFTMTKSKGLNAKKQHRYKNMTQLRLKDAEGFQNIKQLEIVLGRFNQAKEIQLEITQSADYTYIAHFEQWLRDSVKRIETVKNLTIHYDHDGAKRGGPTVRKGGPDWIEYLAHKYPNVETLKIRIAGTNRQGIVLPTFKQLKTFNVQCNKFYDLDALQQFVDTVANSDIQIEWKLDFGVTRPSIPYICMISANNTGNTKLTNFEIKEDYTHCNQNTPAIISMFSTKAIKHWTISAFDGLDSTLLNYILACHVESLRLVTVKMYINEGDQLQTAAALERLELVNAKFGARFIEQLTKSAPNLKHLTLTDCPLANIKLALSSRLSSITLKHSSSTNLYTHAKKLLFCVHTALHSMTFIFYAAPEKPLQMITEHELAICVDPIILIKCGTLQHLKVEIGEIKFTMDFDRGSGLITSASASIEESMYYTLFREHEVLKNKYADLEEKYYKAKNCIAPSRLNRLKTVNRVFK